jgi:hypothetical protein
MAYQQIFTGTVPNDNTGDSLYQGASKVNNNFNEIYNAIGTGNAAGSTIKPISSSAVNKTLLNNETCIVTAASVVLTLPSTPVNGTEITVLLGSGVSSATIQRPDPGAALPTIMGLPQPLIIDIPNGFVTLVYFNSDWRIK